MSTVIAPLRWYSPCGYYIDGLFAAASPVPMCPKCYTNSWSTVPAVLTPVAPEVPPEYDPDETWGGGARPAAPEVPTAGLRDANRRLRGLRGQAKDGIIAIDGAALDPIIALLDAVTRTPEPPDSGDGAAPCHRCRGTGWTLPNGNDYGDNRETCTCCGGSSQEARR